MFAGWRIKIPVGPQHKPARSRWRLQCLTNVRAPFRVPGTQTAWSRNHTGPGPAGQDGSPGISLCVLAPSPQASPRKNLHWSQDVLANEWSWQSILLIWKTKSRHLSPHTNSEQVEGLSMSLETETATGKYRGNDLSVSVVWTEAQKPRHQRQSLTMGFHSTKKFLDSRGNNQQREEITQRVGENVFQLLPEKDR